MKCTSQHEVVVDAEFVESLGEVSLVDQPAGFVDDDECVNDPVCYININDHPFPRFGFCCPYLPAVGTTVGREREREREGIYVHYYCVLEIGSQNE